ncbi:hypothetical protein MPH_10107 [Macrophomina phaseolina MS6]|uniref:Uncharacterized protein n=1 Tax=Macrophomina phaseolina (strain MS6) TaxID=1126212 RepID=K2RDU9_MACPH|nr:hypothetical protein MPH_10107 [Macrophomina phaseolina MS6]
MVQAMASGSGPATWSGGRPRFQAPKAHCPHRRYHVRVPSVVLKLASSVFRVVLGPKLSQGQEPDESEPSDSPQAITITCDVLQRSQALETGVLKTGVPRDIALSIDNRDRNS